MDSLLPQEFGLCGGMAYAAADYFRWQLVPPRGFPGMESVHPDHATSQGSLLRDYLWSRLLDSFTTGGVAIRTLEWMAILHLIPAELGGGADELGRRSRDEWPILKRHLDSGNPWPIALIGTTTAVQHQHQVLVYGYDQINAREVTILFYDPNHPGLVTATVLNFSKDALNASEAAPNKNRGPLMGFFCSDYQPRRPPATVGLVGGLSSSQARAVIGEKLEFTYELQNLGYGISPGLRPWVHGYLPPQEFTQDGHPVKPKHIGSPHAGRPPILHPINPDPGDPGTGSSGDGSSDGGNGTVFTPPQSIDFTSDAMKTAPLVSLSGPVAPSNTSGNPSPPLRLSTESPPLPASGPWQFNGEVEVHGRFGPHTVSVMRTLPVLTAGTTPIATVNVSDKGGHLRRTFMARVVYRGGEGHIHELWLPPNGEWHLGDLTELTGAPPAAGDPAGYVTEVDGTARVVYRGDEGHIHELWLPPKKGWRVGDLTELTGAPPAAGDPASYWPGRRSGI